MATCLVTITGTSGEVLIKYTDSGSVSRYVKSGLGQLYLDDDGSDYEWSTLNGDAAAASGCITLTEIPITCYLFSWQRLLADSLSDAKIDAFIWNSNEYAFSTAYTFPRGYAKIAGAINALNESDFKAVAYKEVLSQNKSEQFLIVKVRGGDAPMLRITNDDGTHFMYIIGETTTCLPAGYTEIDTCEIGSYIPL